MILWLESPIVPPGQPDKAQLLILEPEFIDPATIAGNMMRIGPETDLSIAESLGCKAFYLPAGLGSHLELLERLAKHSLPIYLTVNGMGALELRKAQSLLEKQSVVLVMDVDKLSNLNFLEQLAWFRGNGAKFAIRSTDVERMLVAITAECDALICKPMDKSGLTVIQRISEARMDSIHRPISFEEIDAASDMTVSLVATRSLPENHALEKTDLSAQMTHIRGLPPRLLSAVVGRHLRYKLDEGEPITFVHLRGRVL